MAGSMLLKILVGQNWVGLTLFKIHSQILFVSKAIMWNFRKPKSKKESSSSGFNNITAFS